MFEEFCSYFEGYFNNQMQAFNYPREFAMIELNHRRIEGTNRFTVTQGYVMDGNPYRSVEIEVIDDSDNDQVILKTYKDDEHIPGCDCVFKKSIMNFMVTSLAKNVLSNVESKTRTCNPLPN